MKKILFFISLSFFAKLNAQVCFAPNTNYPVNTQAEGLISADFNKDGKADLAVAATNNVTIMLGNGSGGFTSTTNYNVSGAYFVCTADFNGDGNLDLATSNVGSSNTSVLLGSGTGTFGQSISYPTGGGSAAYSICAADFNGDGFIDLAIPNSANNNVSLLTGTGTGTFNSATLTSGVGNTPYGICSIDFNNDGKLDLAVSNNGSNDVALLQGGGNGTFTITGNITGGGTSLRSIITLDYNQDGLMDLATAGYTSNNTKVYINNGSGGFTLGPNGNVSSPGNSPRCVTSGDYNGDGSLDLATADYVTTGTPYVTVLINGVAGPSINLNGTGKAHGICTADFNGDGKPDLATANEGTPINVSILLNTLPFLAISGNTTICSGTSTILTASGANTYTWSANAGSVTTATVSLTPTVTTTYTVTGSTTGCGITRTRTITVNVDPSPVVNAIATSTFVCRGSNVTLSGSGANTYTWTGGVINGIPFSVSNTQSYTVSGTDTNGCVNTAAVTINTNTNTLAFSASPQNGVAPLPVTFTNSTPSLSNYTFTWYYGDGSNATNNNATVFYTYNFAGLYDVALIATNNATGCKDTLVKPQYVNVTGAGCAHTASVSPAGPLIKCQGDTVILTVNTNAATPYTLQWNFNSVAISGATGNTFSATQGGYYSMTVTKGGCPVTSSATQISFNPNPMQPVITSQGSIITCVNSLDTLICSPQSGVTYLWNTSQTTSSITVSAAGVYNVTVTNTSSCTATSSYTLNAVMTAPTICMVTDDSTSTNNIIVWDKTSYLSADSFIVYREVSTNIYKRIAAVSKDSLSRYIDVNRSVGPANGDPNIGFYHYKIQVRDSCGNYSPLSLYHTSVFFIDNHNGTFTWNTYDVESSVTPVANFNLMRDSANIGDWRMIGIVSGNTTTLNDPTYANYQTVGNWRVEATGFNCAATVRYANNSIAGAIVRSKSNITNNRTTKINQTSIGKLAVYPNPSNGIFVIETNTSEKPRLQIFTVTGELVLSKILENAKNNIDASTLSEGIYNISVSGTTGIINDRLVIVK